MSIGRLRSAFADLLAQEFAPSTGHAATLLNGCAFAPSLLTFWFVNGLVDFSTAFVIGAVDAPGGLVVRLLAYVLLVPVFVLLRASYYLAHPTHRRTVLAGACPQSDLISLDWLGVGILATGLPLALRDVGPWIGMNAVFLVGLFVLPRLLPERLVLPAKLGSIAAGTGLFLFANYGAPLAARVGPVPRPAAVLGPVATLTLSPSTTATLVGVTNSLLPGPPAVALVAVAMNRLLTRPELTSIPVVRRTLPRRDPWRVVVVSAMLGTAFYLGVVALATGRLTVVPGGS